MRNVHDARIAILVLVGATGGSAHAGDDPEIAAPRLQIAVTLSQRGEHRAAVEELLAAYKSAPGAHNLLFNIGSEYYLAAESEGWPIDLMRRSIDCFRQFLAVDPTAPERPEIEEAVKAMNARLANATTNIPRAEASSRTEAKPPMRPPRETTTAPRKPKTARLPATDIQAETMEQQVRAMLATAAPNLAFNVGRAIERQEMQRRETDEKVKRLEAESQKADERAKHAEAKAQQAENRAAGAEVRATGAVAGQRAAQDAARQAETELHSLKLRIPLWLSVAGGGVLVSVLGGLMLVKGIDSYVTGSRLTLQSKHDEAGTQYRSAFSWSLPGTVLLGAGITLAIVGVVKLLAPMVGRTLPRYRALVPTTGDGATATWRF